ncbi:MAG: AMP-binding protein [Bacteroidales bacterium]|nr:AMP-binding protein [Bacteroidales bacterium]
MDKLLKRRDGEALIYKDKHYSYDDLLKHANAYGQYLEQYRPEKVMIFSENRPEWIFAFYGSWLNQATVIPADPMSAASDISYMAADSEPEVLFCSAEKKAITQEAIHQLSNPPEVVVFDEIHSLPEPVEVKEVEPVSDDDSAVIIYTSGTTGKPKGVVLSYRNLKSNMDAVSFQIPIFKPSERVMILLPLHHIFPLMGSMIVVMYSGATAVMAPGMTNEHIINTLQNHKVTILIGVPRLYSMMRSGIMSKIRASTAASKMFSLAKALNSSKLSKILFNTIHKKFGGNLKYMISGGAALDKEVAKDFKTLGFEMLDGYGMTEASPIITFTRPGKWKIGSPGQAMPGVQIAVRDGEIVAKGENVMKGYYNRPEETAEVLQDEWLYTGDLGYVDEKGYLWINGRKKDIIVLSNGKNINPAHLESDLEEKLEGVAETAVISKNDRLHAIIRPDEGFLHENNISDATDYFRKALKNEFNPQVAAYRRINQLTITTNELPRTRLGKLRRFKLNDIVAEEVITDKQKPQIPANFEEYKIIRSFLEEQKSIEISPSDNLEFDIGLDSLDKVSLQTFLHNSFGVDISSEKFMNFPSVVKLAEYIKEKKQKFKYEAINWSEILREHKPLKLPKSSRAGQFLMKVSKYFFRVYFRMSYEGIERIPQKPFIIAPNHQSFLDGFLIASVLKRKTYQNTVFYAKEKHLKTRWLKYLARKNNIIIVDVANDLKSSIQKLAMAIRNHRNVIIFPEGTRSETGAVGPFKNMFAILSHELDVPVVPVVISGAHRAFPRGAPFPKPFTKINLEFLNPVYPRQHNYQSLNEDVRKRILQRVEEEKSQNRQKAETI